MAVSGWAHTVHRLQQRRLVPITLIRRPVKLMQVMDVVGMVLPVSHPLLPIHVRAIIPQHYAQPMRAMVVLGTGFRVIATQQLALALLICKRSAYRLMDVSGWEHTARLRPQRRNVVTMLRLSVFQRMVVNGWVLIVRQ